MPPLAAGALVFTTSAAILVLEILAGRLLAPYVGVTLETYTGIIGVVLAGIALGTWSGGRLADRADPRSTLGPMLVLGGALALLTVPLVRIVGAARLGAGPLAITILAFVGFFAPAAVLAAVSPTVVKLQLRDLDETGRVVGRLSALGTAGALVGTFATGFLLVAALPTRPIVIGVGVLLVAIGAVVAFALRRHVDRGATTLPLLLTAGGLALSAIVASPCDYETAYFCAAVVPDPQRESGRTLVLDTLRHSYVDLEDPTYLEFSYAQIAADVFASLAPPGEPLDVLHIGGGGFSLPRYLAATRPGTQSLVLELDPTLVQIARDELGLETRPDLQVRVGDARVGVRRQPDDAYDLVIGDAFGGQAVPWHLATRELVEEVDRVLRPGGTYVINLIDYPPLGFARAEVATLQSVFEHVAVIAPPERIDRREGGNFILVASQEPIDAAAIQARNDARGDDDEVATGERVATFVGDARVLTDDHAPVDQLLTPLT